MSIHEPNLSIANPHPKQTDVVQKSGLFLAALGIVILLMAWGGASLQATLFLPISLSSIVLGTTIYAVRTYLKVPAGIKNNGIWQNALTNRGIYGWVTGIVLTGFYILLYWFPGYIGFGTDGKANEGLVALFDPLSYFFKGKPASQWFVYGTLYTIAILALGIKFLLKYRHNRYQLIRTASVIVAQLLLAYLIPEILAGLNYNDATAADGTYIGYYDTDIKNMWPLDYDFFYDWHLNAMQAASYQPLGMVYLVIGVLMFLVITPIITYFVGKRWYCSWICGCGGLAETAGDPFRHLSSKKLSAWKLERWLIHLIMVFVFVMTVATLYGYFYNQGTFLGAQYLSKLSKTVWICNRSYVLRGNWGRFLPNAGKPGLVPVRVSFGGLYGYYPTV